MIEILKKTWIPITIIGTVLTAFLFFSPFTPIEDYSQYTIIRHEMRQIGTWTWNFYSFDTLAYLKNLQNSFTNPQFLTNTFTGKLPTLPTSPNWADLTSIYRYIVNSIIFVPNVFIALINYVLIAPIQLLIYPINVVMSLLGINTTNKDFVTAFNFLTNLKINYINYI